MENQEQENQTPQEAGEDTTSQNEDVGFEENELESLDEETKKKIQTLEAQKRHWREKAQKSTQEQTQQKSEEEPPKQAPQKKEGQTVTKEKGESEEDLAERMKKLELSEQKRQFGHEHGLSPQEVDKVFQINPNPDKETLEDPFVKAGLQAIRSQNRTEQNTPSPSGSSPSVRPSKPLNEMTPQERDQHVKEVLKKKAQRR